MTPENALAELAVEGEPAREMPVPLWVSAVRALWGHALRGVLAGLFVAACSPAAPRPLAQPSAEPALWRLADADSEIWLYGSVHVLPASLVWRGPRVDAAFAAADEVVTETDTGALASRYAAMIQEYGALRQGHLSDTLDAPGRAALARTARSLGIDPDSLETSRPWFAAVRLSQTYANAHGHSAEAGVETILIAQARADGKRLSYLETPEQQMRTLADLGPADERRFLVVTLRQIAEEGGALDAVDAAWARGDTAALEALLRAQLSEAGPAAYEALIVSRNRAWAEAIAVRLRGHGRIFYAVGAAHLIGPDSVVALLRARAIAVEGP